MSFNRIHLEVLTAHLRISEVTLEPQVEAPSHVVDGYFFPLVEFFQRFVETFRLVRRWGSNAVLPHVLGGDLIDVTHKVFLKIIPKLLKL